MYIPVLMVQNSHQDLLSNLIKNNNHNKQGDCLMTMDEKSTARITYCSLLMI